MSISDFLDFMPDTVTFTAKTGRSATGAATYVGGAVSTYKARIEMKNHMIVDSKGREIKARGRVILGTTDVPGTEDMITLPSEYVPVSPPILAVNVEPDESGPHHTVVEIG